MKERKITWFVATALDEIACMSNISEVRIISVMSSAKEVNEDGHKVFVNYNKTNNVYSFFSKVYLLLW